MRSIDDRSVVTLPPPNHDGQLSLEAAVCRRRSVREYSADALTLQEVSQLLWAAQGVTHPNGYRTVASAGAVYPLELYLLVGNVSALAPGGYLYHPGNHQIAAVLQGSVWGELWSTVLANRTVKRSAAVLAVTAAFGRMASKYGARAERYMYMEVGHVVQNVYLQAAAMGLATVVLGSFIDSDLSAILGCPDSERPMALMPVGRVG